MNWETDLVAYLRNIAGLTALVGDRILPSTSLQEINLPCLVYQEQNISAIQDRDSDVGLFLMSFNMDTWAHERQESIQVFEAFRDPLLAWTGGDHTLVSRIWLEKYSSRFNYAVVEGEPVLWLTSAAWHCFISPTPNPLDQDRWAPAD